MKKKLLYITAIAAIVLFGFGACSNESLVSDNDITPDANDITPIAETKITLTATMPEGDDNQPDTRVELNKVPGKIAVTWKVGDKLQTFSVPVGSTVGGKPRYTTVKSITGDGKTG